MDAYKKVEQLLVIRMEQVSSPDDKEKCDVIKELLEDDDCFFKLETKTALGMLEYLGVDKEDSIDTYFELISPENHAKRVPKERVTNIR